MTHARYAEAVNSGRHNPLAFRMLAEQQTSLNVPEVDGLASSGPRRLERGFQCGPESGLNL